MKPFATVDDLKLIYHGYKDDDKSRAEALLSFVSAAIRTMCDASSVEPDVLRMVVCQVVTRMMQSSASDSYGITQESWGASPLSGSVSYANPTGDIYLTAFERQLLGIDGDCIVTYVNPEV